MSILPPTSRCVRVSMACSALPFSSPTHMRLPSPLGHSPCGSSPTDTSATSSGEEPAVKLVVKTLT